MSAPPDKGIIVDRGLSKSKTTIHGVNPVLLFEKITREKVLNSLFFNMYCEHRNVAEILRQAVRIPFVGSLAMGVKPAPFLCLILRLLQLQPEREIILELLNNPYGFKYVTALAAFYIRLTFPAKEVYELLEPLYSDYRKLRFRSPDGTMVLTHMDEFIDDLLTKERVCEILLPRLPDRTVLEDTQGLEPRKSAYESELEMDSDEEAEKSGSESHRERQKAGSKQEGNPEEAGEDSEEKSDEISRENEESDYDDYD